LRFLVPLSDSQLSRLAECIGFVSEIEYWTERFNEVATELIDAGYNQIPEAMRLMGYSKGKSHAGSDIFLTKEYLSEIYQQEPEDLHPEHVLPIFPRRLHPCKRNTPFGKLRSDIGNSQDWTCSYCCQRGTPESGPDLRQWHLDHIYPKSKGGDDLSDNLTLSCATCNLKKHARTALEFFRSLRESTHA
jgi:hypothetical protein